MLTSARPTRKLNESNFCGFTVHHCFSEATLTHIHTLLFHTDGQGMAKKVDYIGGKDLQQDQMRVCICIFLLEYYIWLSHQTNQYFQLIPICEESQIGQPLVMLFDNIQERLKMIITEWEMHLLVDLRPITSWSLSNMALGRIFTPLTSYWIKQRPSYKEDSRRWGRPLWRKQCQGGRGVGLGISVVTGSREVCKGEHHIKVQRTRRQMVAPNTCDIAHNGENIAPFPNPNISQQ